MKATECPRIPAKFLEEDRQKLGEDWFAHEDMCDLRDGSTKMFPRELLEKAVG